MTGQPIETIMVLNLSIMIIISFVGFFWLLHELKQLHQILNSRLTELIEASKAAAHASGASEERLRQEESKN
jgi:hypothetical protein